MADFHRIWIDQCAAAEGIRDQHGFEHAIGYLVGEKLVNHVRASETHPEFANELPRFVAEVRRLFTRDELRYYLEHVRRVGALAHVCTDQEIATFREAGVIEDDPVHDAEDVLIVERLKEMLLDP